MIIHGRNNPSTQIEVENNHESEDIWDQLGLCEIVETKKNTL